MPKNMAQKGEPAAKYSGVRGGGGGVGGHSKYYLIEASTEAASAFCHAFVYFHLNIGIVMTASIIVQKFC